MKYQPFVPDPDAIAARIERPGVADASADKHTEAAPARDGGRGRAVASGPGPSGPHDLPTTLDGITALRDRFFVQAAYRVLLGRDPDDAGGEECIRALRGGALDKVDILGDLRSSPEGRARAVDIPGLAWRYRVRRLGRIPVVGRAVRWAETLLRLPAIVRSTHRHQAAIELASVEAEEHVAAILRIQREVREARGLAARFATTEAMLAELMGSVNAAETDLRTIRDELRALEQRVESRHKRLAEATERLAAVAGGRSQATSSSPAAPAGARGPASSDVPTRSGSDGDAKIATHDLESFYLEFEGRFRGSREDTKRLQEVYLDYVRAAHAGTSGAPVVDVGCGRGEWLELLRERGYVGRGVDGNRVMIAENVERGLDVVAGDALAHLAALPDASLGMVTGFHIIEHLPFEQLVRLFDECRRVLRAGGCAVFETPNPENLVVGGYTFHFDPTHRHPLPPQMIEFLAWQRGFAEVEILRLHPRPEVGSDQALLDRWFRTATDYAVIAWKDRKGT